MIANSWELTYFAAGRSRGRQDAEEWLAQHPLESFDDWSHGPDAGGQRFPENAPQYSREEAQRWMDEHAGDYMEWHPDTDDYTHSDVGDAAGQHFNDWGNEATSLPGHFRDENQALYRPLNHNWPAALPDYTPNQSRPMPDWSDSDIEISREPLTHQFPDDHEDMDGVEDDDVDSEFERMAQHGFNWEPLDPTAGTPGNPLSPETPGRYVRHQHSPEGHHVATHVIQEQRHLPPSNRVRWDLTTEPTNSMGSSHTSHTSVEDALDRYRQNSAEVLLPERGYEPDRGRTGWARSWHRTDPNGHDHEIDFPHRGDYDGPDGFSGTSHSTRTGQLDTHHSYDLADVVREHDRLGGLHGE